MYIYMYSKKTMCLQNQNDLNFRMDGVIYTTPYVPERIDF
jgi:hypothetical protein